MLRVPKTTLRLSDFTRRTHRTQHIVILTAMIYCSEMLPSKACRRKMYMGQSPKETRYKFPSVLCRVTQDALNSSSFELWQCVWSRVPRKVIRDSVPKVFIGNCSHRHPLLTMYHTPRRKASVQHNPYCLCKLCQTTLVS